MKLRIHHQCIRFRLSQTDVEQFIQVGELNHHLQLSVMPDTVFRIRLRKHGSRTTAYMSENTLFVDVSDYKCQSLERADIITVEDTIDVSDDNCLTVMIEKDFECLKQRPGLDDVDTFPNPHSAVASC